MSEEYGADIITVVDEEDQEHQFEMIDAIETDDGRYVALLPIFNEAQDVIDDDGELLILEVIDENGEEIITPIEDDNVFESVAAIFQERIDEMFEIEEIDE